MYVVYGQGHMPRHPVAEREQPMGVSFHSTMWVLDTELGHPGWPVVFKARKKKKMTPRTQKFLTVNELYFPTPKFELWFDNFVVLICEFIYKISMSSVVVHACYPSTWKIKKRSSLGYIV